MGNKQIQLQCDIFGFCLWMITSKAEVVVARRKIEKIGKICVVTKRNDEGRLMNKRKK